MLQGSASRITETGGAELEVKSIVDGEFLKRVGLTIVSAPNPLGTVTSVSVATANGFSGTVANATTTPAITIIAGAITPTSVNGVTISGSGALATGTFTLTVTGTASVAGTHTGTSSGTNTGDQTTVSGNAGSATILATGRTIAMTGDVTWTSPSFNGSANVTAAGTIANDAVTYAKMQNMTTARLLGRATAGSGDPEEITLGTGLSFTGTTLNSSAGGGSPGGSNGQVQYRIDATTFGGVTGFDIGASTIDITNPRTLRILDTDPALVLSIYGASGVAVIQGAMQIIAAIALGLETPANDEHRTIDTTSVGFGMDTSDSLREVRLTGGTPTVGRILIVYDRTGFASTNNVKIWDEDAVQTINGASEYLITDDYGGVILMADGANWNVVASFP